MMPPAFSQEVINEIDESKLYDKTRIKSLRQCLDKSTLRLLMEQMQIIW